jgi:hypothetical protein
VFSAVVVADVVVTGDTVLLDTLVAVGEVDAVM